jgi:HEAT repeat protein
LGHLKAKYTERIVGDDLQKEYEVLAEMERRYELKDVRFFNDVLKREPSLAVRVHAVTVLSELGDESTIPVLADVMKHDPSSLIRHECAFSLGQMGLKAAVPYLSDSALNDPSEIVRHESAAALGSIGDESARSALEKAATDSSEEVKGSAIASLFNLDFLMYAKEKKALAVPAKKQLSKKKMPHP